MKSPWIMAIATALVLGAGAARASIVERVVAVVSDEPILLSDVHRRAAPFLRRLEATSPDPAQRAALEGELLREVLERMIDERLEERAARVAHVAVTADEIDAALRSVAAAARLDVPALVEEARRQGLDEQDYRDELRRQVLEGKLVNLRVRGRVRASEADERAFADALERARREWLRELRRAAYVDIRW